MGLDPVIGADADHHLLEVSYVPVHVLPVGPQVENGVRDELTRPVIRHVAAPSRLVDLDSALGEQFGRGENVRPRALEFHAERDDVRVLEEQESVGPAARLALLDDGALELEALRVRYEPEPPDIERAAHGARRSDTSRDRSARARA